MVAAAADLGSIVASGRIGCNAKREKEPGTGGFKSVALIFGLCLPGLAILTGLLPADAEARVRIETGRDLHAACSALADHQLNPTTPTPREALYCRQYLMGYFNALRYLHEDERLKRSFGHRRPIRSAASISTGPAPTTSSPGRSSAPATGTRN